MRAMKSLGLSALLLMPQLAAAEQPPLAVEVVTAEPSASVVPILLTGTIEPVDSYAASFRMAGSVQAILVDADDWVAKGTELARLDPTQVQASANAAAAGLRGAEATLVQAELNHDRVAALRERGTATQVDLDTAVEDLASALAARDQAALLRDKATSALDDTVIRATEDAIVTARLVEPGQVVGAGQAVLDLAGQTGREALFLAPDIPNLDDFLGLSIGLTRLDVPDAAPLTAKITEISPLVDADTGAVKLRARLDAAPTDTPLLGEAVVGHSSFSEGMGIRLPWTALTSGGGGMAVWVVGADGLAELRPVTVARFVTGAVVIRSGLKPGERVVGEGSHMLYPGRPVVALTKQGVAP